MGQLSDVRKRSIAEDIIYAHVDGIEFLSVSEAVHEQFPGTSDADINDIHDLVIHANLDIDFDTDD